MNITQVRNATLIVTFGGKRFLIDPMLAEQGAYPPFAGTPNDDKRNPTVGLPMPVSRIVDVDAVIVTHMHLDHWDEPAAKAIPPAMPIFAQNEQDADRIRGAGFVDVRVLGTDSDFEGVGLTRTPGQHGSDLAMEKFGDRLGQVCGVVFRHPDEKTLYIAGDTVWNSHVSDTLAQHEPDIAVLNCGDAQFLAVGSIIMGADDVNAVAQAAPDAQIVATHMEAVNHAVLTRSALRSYAREHGFADRLHVPEDGETLTL
jgi:L-ascorbate metabolism protein UlaG (beta-lactamase superfamily)